ncbi:DUF3721 domain-containing protein [Synechococcus sp. GFB01]|uniref:DUF3721 domain-containing protein n=1 Tax=Synechococcus sp. GFB01 TaxID=1662190 RepID=UPI00064EE935|nr:DUF3721 domain-containing protein [Synechococcus sp. GFB01]KMM16474.1 hypothetical protein SYNGFB01_10795 [Synechococcus sp. GFB01]
MTSSQILLLTAASALISLTVAPAAVEAHSKGLFKTQAEAEQRARELGCKGTHQNNGLWMPCSDEAHLHQELRQE